MIPGEQRLAELLKLLTKELEQGTNVMALGKALTQAWKAGVAQELRAAGEKRLLELPKGAVAFEETTPMLVMPFEQFKAQGRIFKSTKAWREEALEKQWLVVYDESSGKVVIFVSHTCAAPSHRHRYRPHPPGTSPSNIRLGRAQPQLCLGLCNVDLD